MRMLIVNFCTLTGHTPGSSYSEVFDTCSKLNSALQQLRLRFFLCKNALHYEKGIVPFEGTLILNAVNKTLTSVLACWTF